MYQITKTKNLYHNNVCIKNFFYRQSGEVCEHLCALVDYAFALREALEDINQHSFNKFRLRVGEQFFSILNIVY